MSTFIKINKGDKVFDSIQQITGIVTSINRSTNVAQITTGSPSEDEVILCKLANLTVLKKGSPVDISIKNIGKSVYDYNKWFHQVKEFHLAFNHPVADKPTEMSLERGVSRSNWTVEEAAVEFLQSSSNNEEEFLKAYDDFLLGLEKAKQKSLEDTYTKNGVERIVAQADALTDALYFILGSFVEIGLEPDKLFDIVQNSNMSKLFIDENGNKYAMYRESDGKILKSEHFFEPEPALKAEIKRQLNDK